MDDLGDKILGGWLGRIAGNMLGKPVERGDHWTRERIDRYLRRAGALPLTDYIPALDPLPEEFELRPEWPQCTRGNIHGSARDDDIDYAILGLDLLETHGPGFTTEQVGELWLLRLPYLQTFTAERAAYRNLANGLKPPLTATLDNPYQDWIGALIRADIHGWTSPGDPARAAALARRDAVLSHTGNGVQTTVPLRDRRRSWCIRPAPALPVLIPRRRVCCGSASAASTVILLRPRPSGAAACARERWGRQVCPA